MMTDVLCDEEKFVQRQVWIKLGLGIVLVPLVMGIIVFWCFTRQVNREFTRVVQEGISGPLEKPTQTAIDYQPFMQLKATVSKKDSGVWVKGEIINSGPRAIQQFSVHIRILNLTNNVIAWSQGPVIRTIHERGILPINHNLMNAYSSAEAPFLPKQKIAFIKKFPSVRVADVDLKADLTVMEIEFSDN